MHVKYRQDNVHRMTWYTDMCGMMVMGLLYMLALLSNMCIIWALDLMIVRDQLVVPNLVLAIARIVGSYSVCVSTEIKSTENRVLFKQTNFASRLVLL
jgi:hypothetical protein